MADDTQIPVETPLTPLTPNDPSSDPFEGQPYYMVDPNGNAKDVAPDSYWAAKQAGYQQVPKEVADHIVAVKNAAQHPIKAALVGAENGLVPFGPNILETVGGPTAQEQADLQQGNPNAYKAGKIAGTIGQFAAMTAATDGIGDILGLGAKAGEAGAGVGDAIGDVGQAASDAVSVSPESEAAAADIGTVQPLGTPPVTQSFGKRVLSHMTPDKILRTSLESGTNNVADTINERELGNPDANGESLLSSFGHGALFGAVATPLFGLGAEAVPSVVRGLGTSVAKLADTLQGGLEKVVPKLRPDLLSIAEGDQSAITNSLHNIYAENEPGAIRSRDVQVGRVAQKVANMMNDADDQLQATSKVLNGNGPGSFNQALKNTLDDSSFSIAQPKLAAWADNTQAQLAQQAELNGLNVKPVLNELHNYIVKINSPEVGNMLDLHQASRELRQYLDSSSNWASPVATPEIGLVNKLVTTPMRQNMINPDIWGRDAADLTAKYNAGHEFLQSQKAFYQRLGNTTTLEGARPTKEANGIAIKNLFKRLATGDDTQAEGEVNQLFNERLAGLQNYANMAEEISKVGDQMYDPKPLVDNLKSISEQKRLGVIQASLAKTNIGSGIVSEMAAGMLGHLAGTATGIPGLGLATAVVKGGYDALRGKPALTAEILGSINKMANKQSKVIANGINSFLSKNVVKGVYLASNIKNIEEDNSFKTGSDASLKDKSGVIQRSAEVNNILNNRTALNKILIDSTKNLSDSGLPLHAQGVQKAALNRLNTLKAVLPTPNNNILPQDNKNDINPEQKALINRVYAVVQAPIPTILNGMHNGTLTADQITAAQSSNPQTFSRIQTELQQQILDLPKDTKLNYKQKQMISLVLGGPISPDVNPDQMAFQQQVWNPPTSPDITPPGPQKKAKPRTTGLDKMNLAKNAAFGPPGFNKED